MRLVRSKGVGVFFVSQSPTDIPSTVLEQLGTRILHAMRAHTADSLRKIRAAADTIRPRKGFKTRDELPVLSIGEALVSVIGEDNVPSEVEKVKVTLPAGQIGPISDEERRVLLESTPLRKKYHAGLPDHVAGDVFNRRMKVARGIDPGPEGEVAAPEPKLYLKHVPTMSVAAERDRSVRQRLMEIAGWAAIVCAGLAIAGFI
ncbi:helicase HerA-like domain-containing protein [Mesorhizobium atlanticum]